MIIDSFKRVKRRFMSDIWRRLGALALAIYVWIWINTKMTETEKVSDVVVNVRWDANRVHMVSDERQFLRSFMVQLPNKEREVGWLQSSSYEFEVSIPNDIKGPTVKEFKINDLHPVKKPNMVVLKEMIPSTIRVSVDQIVTEWKSVTHLTSKVTQNGDMIRFVLPSVRVKMTGPSNIVRNLQSLTLKEPDLSVPFGSTLKLPIVNPDPSCVTFSPQEVTVTVEKQLSEEREVVDLVPGILLPPNTDLSQGAISLPTVSVRVHGAVEELKELDSPNSPLRVFVDLSKATDVGPWDCKVLVGGLPNGMEVVKIEPDTIHDIILTRRETAHAPVPASTDTEVVGADDNGHQSVKDAAGKTEKGIEVRNAPEVPEEKVKDTAGGMPEAGENLPAAVQ